MAARNLVLQGGSEGLFFYLVCWLYRRAAAGDAINRLGFAEGSESWKDGAMTTSEPAPASR